jgi:flagellar motor switch protein FliN
MMEDSKPQSGLDDESWMDEMGWGDDTSATPEPEPALAAAMPVPVAAPAMSVPAFAPLPGAGHAGDNSQIDLLLDISLQVTVELGRARMKIQEILALRNGSVIELDRLAGEPADILVNGTLIAKGEVVTVNGRFGIRVIDVIAAENGAAALERRK